MEYLDTSDDSLKRAAEVLRGGGIVAFPTETVYGLGADAYNPCALVKVFEAKNRPRFDPLIIHIAGMDMLNDVCDFSVLSEEAKRNFFLLAKNFFPGPLSVVLPKNGKIPGIATAGLNTVAVRFPAHEAARKLISLAGAAIAAPSANPFGALSPSRAKHVLDGLGEKADIILDGGAALVGVESTVLDITRGQARILRHGGVPKEAVESVIGSVLDCTAIAADTQDAFTSPGQLKSHYAPRTRLTVFKKEGISGLPLEADAVYLFFDRASREEWEKARGEMTHNGTVRELASFGGVSEAAARLFETLHELDSLGASRIYAQEAPMEGLGAAINDRLKRAGA